MRMFVRAQVASAYIGIRMVFGALAGGADRIERSEVSNEKAKPSPRCALSRQADR